MKETTQAAEGKGVGLELPTVRCPSPQWGGGEWGWGLEEPAMRLSFQTEGEINNCHFS
ncbi:MAG TPA: hypothetical protein VKV18_00525 [Chthonomonas sp.]|uniref:hypothetical protein n=1 Tax=Chthonomonas sp. TaxID=2282153 RepID=UPI002B4AC6D9|nr:hypothetical protein [Chthonomonas sp.]HLI47162.1 hypothetical protein [Chthonomonas sp.]